MIQDRDLFAPRTAATIVLLAGGATIAGAWFIEVVLGIKPCPLCLEQRIPYYVGLPIAALALFSAARGSRPTAALLGLTALAFFAASGMGAYHAGVEWGLWKGPTDCSGPMPAQLGMQDFLKQLSTVKVIRCDEVAMRIFGLSLAAWNAVIAGGLGLLAATAAWRAQGSSSVSQ